MSMHCITIYIGNWSKRGLGYQRSLTHIWWHMRSGNLALWAERESERIRKRRCVHKPSCFFVYRHENGCVLASFQATHFHLHLKNHEINVEEALYFWGGLYSLEGILGRANFMVILLQQTGNCSNVISKCTFGTDFVLPPWTSMRKKIICEHNVQKTDQKVAYLQAKLMRKIL